MTDADKKREFVERTWQQVVPSYNLPPHFFEDWIPEELLAPLGRFVNKQDHFPSIRDEASLENSFQLMRSTIHEKWDLLQPELAKFVIELIEELGLWPFFDRQTIKMSLVRQEFAKVRFDIADIIFLARKEKMNAELISLNVSVENKTIGQDAKLNEPTMLQVVRDFVLSRAQIDLSILSIQKISRGDLILNRVRSRIRFEYENYWIFLRDTLRNSTLWIDSSGKLFLGEEDVPRVNSAEMQDQLNLRLKSFEDPIVSYMNNLAQSVPPMEIWDECAKVMRSLAMSTERNTTTNIHISDSQVGLLNTGTIERVQSIDQVVTALHGHGDISMGQALKELSEGIISAKEIADTKKNELLDQLKFLGEQANNEKSKRNSGVIAATLQFLENGLSSIGALSSAWGKWGPIISKFFGL